MNSCYNDGLTRAEDQWVLGSPRRDAPEKVDPDAEENWVAHDTGNTVQRNRVTGKFRTRPGYIPPDPPTKSYDYPVIVGADFGVDDFSAGFYYRGMLKRFTPILVLDGFGKKYGES